MYLLPLITINTIIPEGLINKKYMNKKILFPSALTFSLIFLVGCGQSADEPTGAVNTGVSGAGSADEVVLPSPLADDNAPAVEVTPEQRQEIERKSVSAKECTDGGGLYNTEMEKCFASSAEEAQELEGGNSGATTLEVLDSDDEETRMRKECVNSGGTYNTEQKECFEDVK